MKPRKRVVVYCSDADKAQHIAFVMSVRMQVQAMPISRFSQVSLYPNAQLVVVISLSVIKVDYQARVDEYCKCETLVWHPRLGAQLNEFLRATKMMLVGTPGPKASHSQEHRTADVFPGRRVNRNSIQTEA